MTYFIKFSLYFIVLLGFNHLAIGQYQIGIIPRTSPDKSVSQKVGYTQIDINYGSPAVNNRIVWGELEMNDFVGAVQYTERMMALENQRYLNRKAEMERIEERLKDWQKHLDE